MRRLFLAGALPFLLVGCDGGDGSVEFREGMEALDRRDSAVAARLFRESLEHDPCKVDAFVGLARAELELGHLEASRAAVSNAAAFAAADLDVIELQAQVAYFSRDYAMAKARFAALAANESLPAKTRAVGWAGIGVVEMSKLSLAPVGSDAVGNGRDLARIAFLRALHLDNRNAAARYHLGMLYRDEEPTGFDYPESALEQFTVFVRLEQEADPRVQRVQRTIIPELNETIARAVRESPRAVNRNSAVAAAALQRAQAAVKAGRNDLARTEFLAALKADPLSVPAAKGLAECWMKTPPSTKKGGEPNPKSRALTAYLIACRLNPSSISTFLKTGELAARLGRHATAVAVYSRAVAASPKDISAIDGLIRALRNVGGRNSLANAYQSYREFVSSRRK